MYSVQSDFKIMVVYISLPCGIGKTQFCCGSQFFEFLCHTKIPFDATTPHVTMTQQ